MFRQIILLLAALWILFRRWQKRRLYNLSRKLKSDYKKYPIIGHAYLLLGNGEERMKTVDIIGRDSIKHGGFSNFWIGENYYVVLSDADAIKLVLKECLEKDSTVLISQSLIGNGSLIAPVAIWRRRRKTLVPIFHHKHLNQFMGTFVKQSNVLVERFQKVAGTGSVSIWNYITSYAVDVVCQTTLGGNGYNQNCTNKTLVMAFDICLRILTQRMVQPWFRSDLIFKLSPMSTKFNENKRIIIDFINEAISAQRKYMKKTQSNSNQTQDDQPNEIKSSLEMLIQSSDVTHNYSDLELQEEAMVLVLAAIDTSSIAVSFTAMVLARYMDVQQKVYQELQLVFGDSDRDIESEDLSRLTYLEAVIKESLRLYPPIPVLLRNVDKDVTLPSGLTLVKGCGVGVHIWALHRNPRYWGDDAEIFNPDRFMQPLKYPNAFVPFSYGPRNCIGYQFSLMSMKTVLATLMRKYLFLPAEDQNDITPSKRHFRVTYDVRIKDAHGFQLRLERRNQKYS